MFHGGWSSTAKQKKDGRKKVLKIPRIADDPSPLSRKYHRQPDVPRCRCGAGVPQVISSSEPENEKVLASTCKAAPEPNSLPRSVVDEARRQPSQQRQPGVETSAIARGDRLPLVEDDEVTLCCKIARDGEVPLTTPDRVALQQAVADKVLPIDVVDQILKMDLEERWPDKFQDVEDLVERALQIYTNSQDQEFLLKLRRSLPRNSTYAMLFADWAQDQKTLGENRRQRLGAAKTKDMEPKNELVNELRYLLKTMVQACMDHQDNQIADDAELINLVPECLPKGISTSFSTRFDDTDTDFFTGAACVQDVADLLSQARNDGEERARRIGRRWLEYCRKDGMKVREANLSKFSILKDRVSEIDRSSQLRDMYNSLKERSNQIEEATNQLQHLWERKPESVASMQHIESIVLRKLEADLRLEFRNETQQLLTKCSQERALHEKRLTDALALRTERASQLQRQLRELLKFHRAWGEKQQERLSEEIAECQKRKVGYEEKIGDLKKTIEDLRRKIPYAQQKLSQAYLSNAVRLQLRIELGEDKVAISYPSDDTVISVAFAYVSEQEQALFPRHALDVAMQLAQSKANAILAEAVWEPAAFDPTRYQFDRVQKMLQRARRANHKPVVVRRVFLGPPLQQNLMRLAELFDAPAASALAMGYIVGKNNSDATPFQQLIFRAIHAIQELVQMSGVDASEHLEAPLMVLIGLLFTLGRLLRGCKLLSLQLGCRALKLRANALRGLLGKPVPQGAEAAITTISAYLKTQRLIAHGTQRMRSKLDEFRLAALPAVVRHYREIDEIVRVMNDIVNAHAGYSSTEGEAELPQDIVDLSALLAAVPRDEAGRELEEGSAALPLHVLQALKYLRTMLRLQHVSRRWLFEALFVPQDPDEISSQLDAARRQSQAALEDRNVLRQKAAEANLLMDEDLWADLKKDLIGDTSEESETEAEHEINVAQAQERKRNLYLKSMQNFKRERVFRKRIASNHQRISRQLFQRRHSAPGLLQDPQPQSFVLEDFEIRDCMSVCSSLASIDNDEFDTRAKIMQSRRRASDPLGWPAPIAARLHARSACRKDAIYLSQQMSEMEHYASSFAQDMSYAEIAAPDAPSPEKVRAGIERLRKFMRNQIYGGKKGGIVKGTTARAEAAFQGDIKRQISIPVKKDRKVETPRAYVDVFIRTPVPSGGSNLQLNINLGEGTNDAPELVSPKTLRRKAVKVKGANTSPALLLEPTLKVTALAPISRVDSEGAPLTPRSSSGRLSPRTRQLAVVEVAAAMFETTDKGPLDNANMALHFDPMAQTLEPGGSSAATSQVCSRDSSTSRIASFSETEDEQVEPVSTKVDSEHIEHIEQSIPTRSGSKEPVVLCKEWDFGAVEQDAATASQTNGFRRLLQRDFGSNDHSSPGFETTLSQCLRRRDRPSSAHSGIRWHGARRHRMPAEDETLKRRFLCLLAPGKTVESSPCGSAHDRAPLVGRPVDVFNEFMRHRLFPAQSSEDAMSDHSTGSESIARQSSATDDGEKRESEQPEVESFGESLPSDAQTTPQNQVKTSSNIPPLACDDLDLGVDVTAHEVSLGVVATVPNFDDLHPGWIRRQIPTNITASTVEVLVKDELEVVDSHEKEGASNEFSSGTTTEVDSKVCEDEGILLLSSQIQDGKDEELLLYSSEKSDIRSRRNSLPSISEVASTSPSSSRVNSLPAISEAVSIVANLHSDSDIENLLEIRSSSHSKMSANLCTDEKADSDDARKGSTHPKAPETIEEEARTQSSEAQHDDVMQLSGEYRASGDSLVVHMTESVNQNVCHGETAREEIVIVVEDLAGDVNQIPSNAWASPTTDDENHRRQVHPSVVNVTDVLSTPIPVRRPILDGGDVGINLSQFTAHTDKTNENRRPLSPSVSEAPVELFVGSEVGLQHFQRAPDMTPKGSANLAVRPLSAAAANLSPRYSPTSPMFVEGGARTPKSPHRTHERPLSAASHYLPTASMCRPITPRRRPTSATGDPVVSRAFAAVAAHRRIQQLRDLVASDGPLSDVQQREEGCVGDAVGWNMELPIIQARKRAPHRKVAGSTHCAPEIEHDDCCS